jgi:hypothetical protein
VDKRLGNLGLLLFHGQFMKISQDAVDTCGITYRQVSGFSYPLVQIVSEYFGTIIALVNGSSRTHVNFFPCEDIK